MNEKQTIGTVLAATGVAFTFYSESSERRQQVEEQLGFYGPKEAVGENAKLTVVFGDIAVRAASVAACVVGFYLIFTG
jgi:hypothetical protein